MTERLKKHLSDFESVQRELIAMQVPTERQQLEQKHGVGNVWNTDELKATFDVVGFCAPFCVVKRKADGVMGTVEFQHNPRLYYSFVKDSE